MDPPPWDAPPPEEAPPPAQASSPPDYTGESSYLIETAITDWNARDWPRAAKSLAALLASSSQNERPDINLRVILHLVGICASFNGQYAFAKRLFEGALEQQLNDLDVGQAPIDELDISVAHWLGDTCFLLREVDNAALAWSIALSHAENFTTKLEAQRQRLRSSLTLIQTSHFKCRLLPVETNTQLEHAFSSGLQNTITIFIEMPWQVKMSYLKLALPSEISLKDADFSISPFTKRPQDIRVSASVMKGPHNNSDVWQFQYDRFLLLDPRKFRYISTLGLDVNYIQLGIRFMPNLRGGAAIVPRVPLTTIYNSRKRTLKWIVTKLQEGLHARGMLCTQYYDRLKVVRVRTFGLMDYVESFTVVFVRTPGYVVFGLQVPVHLVRDSWKTAYVPAPLVRSRVVDEIRRILDDADSADDADDADGESYKDIWVSTDNSWRNTWSRPRQPPVTTT